MNFHLGNEKFQGSFNNLRTCKLRAERRLKGHGPLVFDRFNTTCRCGRGARAFDFASRQQEQVDGLLDDRGDGLSDGVSRGAWGHAWGVSVAEHR